MLPSSLPAPGACLRLLKPLIVATGNPGKLREFRALLADLPFDLRGLGELGVASPEESGATFLENALLKARHAAARRGQCCGHRGRLRTRGRRSWRRARGFSRLAMPGPTRAMPTTMRSS